MSRALHVVLVLCVAAAAYADDETEAAARLYAQGKVAFDAQRYDDAIAAWKRSLALSDVAKLHFNLGLAYQNRDAPGDCARARRQYDDFLRTRPDAIDAEPAHKKLAELGECPLALARAEHGSHSQTRTIAVATLAAGGVALLVTGVYFGHRASVLDDELAAQAQFCNDNPPCDASMATKARDTEADRQRDAVLGYSLGALGVAAIAGAAVTYWLGREASITPTPQHSGAIVSVRLSW